MVRAGWIAVRWPPALAGLAQSWCGSLGQGWQALDGALPALPGSQRLRLRGTGLAAGAIIEIDMPVEVTAGRVTIVEPLAFVASLRRGRG